MAEESGIHTPLEAWPANTDEYETKCPWFLIQYICDHFDDPTNAPFLQEQMGYLIEQLDLEARIQTHLRNMKMNSIIHRVFEDGQNKPIGEVIKELKAEIEAENALDGFPELVSLFAAVELEMANEEKEPEENDKAEKKEKADERETLDPGLPSVM